MPTSRRRIGSLIVAAIVTVSMIALATSLRQLEFSPGQPLPVREQEDTPLDGPSRGPLARYLDYLYLAFLTLSIIVLPLAIFYLIVSPEARKRLLRNLVILVWLALLFLAVRERPSFFQKQEAVEQPQTLLLQEGQSPTVQFVANPPQWAVTLLAMVLAVLLAAAIVGIVWLLWRRFQRSGHLEQLAQEAEVALKALRSGADLRDTVIQCYAEMSRVVSTERGIYRELAMTPREFERRLGQAGLPEAPVQQLTRLFEAVRYGARTPGDEEERRAIACLTDIIAACRSVS